MKTCISCKHHTNGRLIHWCNLPDFGINPVTGENHKKSCASQRTDTPLALCGPDASRWEAKSVIKSTTKPWWKIFG